MIKHEAPQMNSVFRALGDATRRRDKSKSGRGDEK
jgi:hypothetical protein